MARTRRTSARSLRNPLQRVRATGEALAIGAAEARQVAAAAVGRLEQAFEERLQRAASRLGVPTSRDLRALSEQVARLQRSVDQLRRGRARA